MKTGSGRIRRIVQILMVLQSEQKRSAVDLAGLFKTTERTIYRDMEILRSFGISYHYDSQQGGYQRDMQFFLPPTDLEPEEALSLILFLGEIGEQIEWPLKASAIRAGLKIQSNMAAELKDYCNRSMENISLEGVPQAVSKSGDTIFRQLQWALSKKRKVQILYKSLFEGEVIETELSAYHIMYNRRAWYVLGFSGLHKSVRTFKLNRIEELTICDKCYVVDDEFDLSDYFGKAWSMIPEGRIYNVKLRFLPKVANNVSEVWWHSTQKVTRNEDGSATMEFRVDGLGEITWWILGYGNEVQILGPKVLRENVIKIAKSMIEINESL